MHPSESLKGTKSDMLAGKRIVLGITGSIAAVECFELARELIRHGAEVHAVLSEEALHLVTPWTMQFATGHEAIVQIDGRVQHVSLLGDTPGKADLYLIAPCTANTISKIACGIDDTPVTTMATIAIGSKTPVLIAAAMHLAMYQNPLIQKNVEMLRKVGIEFIGPRVEEKKAKVATTEEIVERVIRRLARNDFDGKKVLIIGGSSEEPIDEMRVITNRGTGETAVRLALAAFERGAETELWMGRCSVPLPGFIPVKRFRTVEDLTKMTKAIDHDVVIVPAALSDYAPKKAKGKIPTDKGELTLSIHPLPKVIDILRGKTRILVGFKAEIDVSAEELVRRANRKLKSVPLDMVVANDLRQVFAGDTTVTIVTKGEVATASGRKSAVAHRILDEIAKLEG
jgi:phosphopantothenoylcysteine decarboxylase/phosphopantothenate--cysteine ligase